jgi:glutamate synthase (NADPH/NADH)
MAQIPNPDGNFEWLPKKQGLYDPAMERDSCGVGMICELSGVASRKTVVDALQVLDNLDHRGARGCEYDTGDGGGILCSMPDKFMRRVFKEQDGIDLPPPGQYAAGNIFFPSEGRKRADAKRIFMEYATNTEGVSFLGWRKVPTNSEGLGATAANFEPYIEQCLVQADGECAQDQVAFEAALYTLRRISGKAIKSRLKTSFYICTLSSRTINYKGMLTCGQVGTYFPDLQVDDFEAHVAIVHSRFSTNTFPSWQRAHPYRLIAHNGEINTIRGNTNWMKAREQLIASDKIPKLDELFPLFEDDQTDSSQLDNIMDVMAVAGRSLSEIAVLMVPQAWEKTPFMPPDQRDFYKVQASLMEPWDGPALICFTDSNFAGACLDRNGLRPCRYYLTKDQRLICASEAGVLPDIAAKDVAQKGRLRPGHILSVDFQEHRVIFNDEIKQELASRHPFGKWIKEEGFTINDLKEHARRPARRFSWKSRGATLYNKTPTLDADDAPQQGDPSDQSLRAFGYSQEILEMILRPMAVDGAEALGSMGNDTPLACLSDLPRPVYDFFYQRFAQVSNPPVDPIRESMVMSLSSWIGPEQNLLAPLSPVHCRRLWLEHPCLLPKEMDAIYAISGFRGWKCHVVDTTFPVCESTLGMRRHLKRVCNETCDAIRFGNCQLVVLSDRAVGRERAAIPALIVAGAVHQTLVREKLRLCAGVIIDSGEPCEVAHHSLLATFGADAVCPYNAYEAILKLDRDGDLPQRAQGEKSGYEDRLFENYRKAVGAGMLKVMAKMGISTLQSYKGAQIADPIGLDEEITTMCFLGSSSQVGGFSLSDIAVRTLQLHQRGFPTSLVPKHMFETSLPNEGKYHLRQLDDTETHLNDPMAIAKLQEAARTNSRAAYNQFAQIHNRLISKTSLRGQLAFRNASEYDLVPIPIEEVEPASEIVKRFRTGAMSYGSISMEAHATLAIAMNKMGGLSNTGEGGEDPSRFKQMDNGGSANSAIKQVASGRFGVTIDYLTNSREVQIKMAQGAKPGEGGELPGWKVLPHIAQCRNSTPGVGLVSPPPHHDIYSIEDLAQLIHDLKCANPKANVSVKLVSERGVGVVAAGVAKCKADHILISGCDGGTGASKWTGIKSTGAPWELGLAEAHQTLVLNGLRGRVSLETDGQLRTGRDVVIAALLGAEHFGFATAPLIAMGCIMMRKCHLNTCPVGIATQDPDLRKKFEGLPEHVVNYLLLVAEEARILMSKLGFRTMNELIGHAEALTVDPANFQVRPLELEALLVPAQWLEDAGKIGKVENRKLYDQDHSDICPENGPTAKLIKGAKETIETGKPTFQEFRGLRNLSRSVGTTLSHELCKAWGNRLPAGACHVKMFGTAGQSFGAFAGKGLFMELEGDAQDYFGKGLSGGMLAIYPDKEALDGGFKAEENVIIGNVALYGGTEGVALVRGVCSERFAVRNSGVWCVVEGAGDHCCEYMTGGRVAVLGETGSNFAAGMSGGVAWVFDPDDTFSQQVAEGTVDLTRMSATEKHPAYPHDADDLKELLTAHEKYTGSTVAKQILAEWPQSAAKFTRVFPTDFKNALDKGDKGVSGTEQFRSFLAASSTAGSTPKIAEVAKISPFSFPDIEEAGLPKGTRPKKVEDAQKAGAAGFKAFDRAEISKRDVNERASDFLEVYEHKDEELVKTQAARCMDCGTPFCHQSVTTRSGCPLGNLIPEWNALVKKGHWHQAFQRLRATNNFPEFTGRVCPAPCEAACTLGIIDDPVGIKSVELMIVDKAYEMGWMEPCPPPFRTGKKVAVVGSGPAGLAAADELNKMGHTVTVYERADRVGGLMMYGVPNMKADKADVVQRRVDIMAAEGVTFLTGKAGNIGGEGSPSAQDLEDSNDAVLLAMGATVGRDLKQVPGRSLEGVHLAMQYLHGSTQALLDNDNVGKGWRQGWGSASSGGPDWKGGTRGAPLDARGKSVIIIGGGDTGNDCIGTSVRQGAKNVVNLELMPKPPPQRSPTTPWPHWPTMNKVDYGHEEAAETVNKGEDIRKFSVNTKEFIGDASGHITALKIVDLEWTHADGRMQMKEVPGSEKVLEADLVLLALGFLGADSGVGESLGVKVERGNFVAAYNKSPKDFRTANRKVFAAGDCRRGQSLVVWAIAEGRDASKAIHKFLMD